MAGPNGVGCAALDNPTSVVPLPVGSSPISPNSSDNYIYDDSSLSDGSLYASDQENLSSPRRSSGQRSLAKIQSDFRRRLHKRRSTLRSPQQQIQQRQAANLRERRRMQSINDAFEGLRAHIPTLPYEKRLSKVDTLKLAIGYIGFLGELVRVDSGSETTLSSGVTNTQNKEEQKKVIVKGSNLQAHSLSWSGREESQTGSTLHAKIWMPEDPRLFASTPTILDKDELSLTSV